MATPPADRDATSDRLDALVGRTWPGASIAAREPLAGDASARRYVRLRLRGAGPATTVAMLLPPGEAHASEELTAGGESSSELPFVDVGRFLASRGVPVPGIHADATAEGVLLLEDVGDLPLAEGIGADPAPLREAVDVLARLSALGAERGSGCGAFRSRYDRELIGRELEVVHTHGFAELPGGPPRRPGSDPDLEAALSRLGDDVAALPTVLMHRDYHAWNLHLAPGDRLVVIDFQDALLGPALYDLASLFTDRDSHRFVDPAVEADLVERYAERLRSHGGPDLGSGAPLRHAYFTAVAYRTLRVVGRFGFLAIERGKPGYLRFLAPMAAQTRRALLASGRGDLLDLVASRNLAFAGDGA
ncbi:phosphotransferase [bacterium]|nr:phosphotransferase [bacterium]